MHDQTFQVFHTPLVTALLSWASAALLDYIEESNRQEWSLQRDLNPPTA